MRSPRLITLMDEPAEQPKACNLKLRLRRVVLVDGPAEQPVAYGR
jgi:hypothetical protein